VISGDYFIGRVAGTFCYTLDYQLSRSYSLRGANVVIGLSDRMTEPSSLIYTLIILDHLIMLGRRVVAGAQASLLVHFPVF
jgi:hypothetical protein